MTLRDLVNFANEHEELLRYNISIGVQGYINTDNSDFELTIDIDKDNRNILLHDNCFYKI